VCKKNEKSVDHLLLHYEIVDALWNTIFSNVGLVWLCLGGVVEISLPVGERQVVGLCLMQFGR
jgi:hypothetical protein